MTSRPRTPKPSWEPLCWDCGQVALPATGACPHCRAELRGVGEAGPSPGARPPRVTRRWHVRDVSSLSEVCGWLHDADWDDEAMRWEGDDVLSVPFVHQPTTVEECGQSGSRMFARAQDGTLREGTPFVHCRVVVRHASSAAIAMEERDAPRMFSCAEHDPVARRLTFLAVVGPELHVGVERLDLTLEMTDQLAHYGDNGWVAAAPPAWDAEAGRWW